MVEIKVIGLFQVDRKQQVVIIVIVAVILFTAGYRVSRWQAAQYREPGQPGDGEVVKTVEAAGEIVVHVAGAVEKPGVYRFTGQMRVTDALEKAVPLENADIQGLNLAAALKDGQKIVVPLKQEEGQPTAAERQRTDKSAAAGKININRASARELEALPGVGPTLAVRVVNHRKDKGYFTSEEDIKNVPGIGDKLYEQIKDHIRVN